MTTSAHTDRPSSKQSWLARAAFAALVLAVAVLLIFAGLKALTMLILGIGWGGRVRRSRVLVSDHTADSSAGSRWRWWY